MVINYGSGWRKDVVKQCLEFQRVVDLGTLYWPSQNSFFPQQASESQSSSKELDTQSSSEGLDAHHSSEGLDTQSPSEGD